MKTYYTLEMASKTDFSRAAGVADKIRVRNEICAILEKAGSEGMTPAQLTEAVDQEFYPEYKYGVHSTQRIVGNTRQLIAIGLVERRETEDKEHTIKVTTVENVFTALPDGSLVCRPAGTEIEIPTKKVVYVWVG